MTLNLDTDLVLNAQDVGQDRYKFRSSEIEDLEIFSYGIASADPREAGGECFAPLRSELGTVPELVVNI